MKYLRGQSSLEWLITHAWSILVVLSVSAVLFYTGVFEASARAQFEGLDAAGLRPVPEHVKLYSDGVMVFTVLNARPYSVEFEWVEVAPIADSNDVIHTEVNAVLKQGALGVFEINASNLLLLSSASLSQINLVSAENPTVSFHVCLHESYSAGGQQSSRTLCGKGVNVEASTEPSAEAPDCKLPGVCPCEPGVGGCPLWCQDCLAGFCSNSQICSDIYGPGYMCLPMDGINGAGCFYVGE